MAKDQKARKENLKPKRWAWIIFTLYSYLFTFFHNKMTFDRTAFKNRNKKEGSIVLFSHNSNKDHYLIARTLKFSPVSFVVSSHFYYNKLIRKVLSLVRAIPKEQFKSDIMTIKKIKRSVQAKVTVAIAPAGQISVHGDAMIIDPAIVKLLKMCNVDVYAVRIHGAYYAYPKWREYSRRNRMHGEIVKVVSKEELKSLPEDVLYKKICEMMTVNDRLEVNKYNYKLKSKGLIEGLEKILYRCPKCGINNQLVTKKDIIACNNCNNQMRMNQQGLLEGVGHDFVLMQDEAVWYKWQQSHLIPLIQNNTLYIEGTFDLYHDVAQYELAKVGTGQVILTSTTLTYKGSFEEKNIVKEFKLDNLVQLPFEAGKHFDIPDEEGYFEFKCVESEKVSIIIEFVQAVEMIAKLRNQKDE